MPPQPARPALRMAQAGGLTLFVITLAVLTALFVTFAAKGVASLQQATLLLCTAAGILAVVGMGWDAVDLWLRGRRMTEHSVKLIRSGVFVAVLVAVGSSFFARTSAPVLILAPAMIVYLFVARRPPGGAPAAGRGAGAGAVRSGSTGGAKARQRRGGKKHK